MSAPRLASVLLTACLSLAACEGDDGARDLRCGDEACSTDCTALGGPACDVHDARCRERIFAAVRCVRGERGQLPQFRVLTEAEYRAELLDAGAPDAGDAATDAGAVSEDMDDDAGVDPETTDATERDPWPVAFSLLKLLPEAPPMFGEDEITDRSQRFLASDRIFAVLIVIAVTGLAIDILLRVLRDRVGRWV